MVYHRAYLMELQEANRTWVSAPGNMFQCDVFRKDRAPWALWAGICCVMAVQVHVKKIFIYREVWRRGAAPETYIFGEKQGNSCLKKTSIWHFHFTPSFKQLRCPVKEAKLRSGELPARSQAVCSKQPEWAACAQPWAQRSSKDSEDTCRKRTLLPNLDLGHEWFMNRKQGYIHQIIYM